MLCIGFSGLILRSFLLHESEPLLSASAEDHSTNLLNAEFCIFQVSDTSNAINGYPIPTLKFSILVSSFRFVDLEMITDRDSFLMFSLSLCFSMHDSVAWTGKMLTAASRRFSSFSIIFLHILADIFFGESIPTFLQI